MSKTNSPMKHRSIKQFLGEKSERSETKFTVTERGSRSAAVDISPIKSRDELLGKIREIGFNDHARALYKAWSLREMMCEGVEIFVATPGFDDSACKFLTEHNPYKNEQDVL